MATKGASLSTCRLQFPHSKESDLVGGTLAVAIFAVVVDCESFIRSRGDDVADGNNGMESFSILPANPEEVAYGVHCVRKDSLRRLNRRLILLASDPDSQEDADTVEEEIDHDRSSQARRF